MTYFERIIALAVIAILLVFAIAEQVEIGKLHKEIANGNESVLNQINAIQKPTPAVQQVVYKTRYVRVRVKHHKRPRRAVRRIKVAQVVTVPTEIRDQSSELQNLALKLELNQLKRTCKNENITIDSYKHYRNNNISNVVGSAYSFIQCSDCGIAGRNYSRASERRKVITDRP
jgi:phosphopantothenate synthetase